jgi:hypothetical protein
MTREGVRKAAKPSPPEATVEDIDGWLEEIDAVLEKALEVGWAYRQKSGE